MIMSATENSERGGGDEADRETLLAGRQAETAGDVGLAGPTVAKRDEVLAALDVRAAGQLPDQRLVERRDGLEVEGIGALDHGEARRLDPGSQFTARSTGVTARTYFVNPLMLGSTPAH